MIPKMNEDGTVEFGLPHAEAERVYLAMLPHTERLFAVLEECAPKQPTLQLCIVLACAGSMLPSWAGEDADKPAEPPNLEAVRLADVLVSMEGPHFLASLLTRMSVVVPQMVAYTQIVKAMEEAAQ